MGYSYRNNGQIKDYWPDDNENTAYYSSEFSITQILELIKKKWPNTPLENIVISSEHIHTSCLTYDHYDSSDYTNFVVITRVP